MTSPPSNEPKKLPLRVKLPFATESEFVERYGVHVARGGIFIATRAPKPEGTLLSFELVLADGARLMRGEGVVQTVSNDPQPGKAGMLVRLTRIDAKTKALIDQIVTAREGLTAPEAPAVPASPLPSAAPVVTTPPRGSSPSRPPSLPPMPIPSAGPVALADDVVLGIDLGTTTCRAAVVIDGVAKLVPIPSERGGTAMPSIVALDPQRARLLVGSDARKHRIEKPQETIVGFKRLLGRRAASKKVKELSPKFSFALTSDPEGDVGIELGGRVYPLVTFAAELLKELKNAAQNFLGRPLSRAVLCVPAWYTDHQRSAVIEAARLAGLEVRSILNEPSAVALAFGYGKGLARKRVLVYDLGGGTFDASVVEITGDDLEVVSTGGDDFLGGLDFDERLADALLSSLPDGARNRLTAVSNERVRDAAEVAKIALSEATTTSVHVPFASTADDGTPVDLRVDVERSFLESVTADLVERTVQATQVVLEAAKLQPQSLDELLLVGGQSRAPAVRKRLEQVLGRAPRSDVDPQGAVALGAALFGQSLVLKERGKSGLSLSEVLVAPIGIAVKGGGFRRVLERNTRLPAEKNLVLPVVAGTPLSIGVFQGSSARAEENEYLGALTTACERSGDMQVRFAVAADGRLVLSATTPLGREAEVTFATAQASDALQAQLLASAPLPGDDQKPTSSKSGLFGGIKKLFGR